MDVLGKPTDIDNDVIANLGPLAPLAGTWEGDAGRDVAPAPDGPRETAYRERATFEPVGPVVNGGQVLYGLRYATIAWPLGEHDPFHQEVGYWLWDPASHWVLRQFMVPRGIMINAGAQVQPDARAFKLSASCEHGMLGILRHPARYEAVDTVRYELAVNVAEDGSFSYAEDTMLKIRGQDDLFHHTDGNTLRRV